jgi:insulysin
MFTGECYLFETENAFHKSSCSELYLQCGQQNDQSNVYVDLLSQILSEPCYNVLRTKVSLTNNSIENLLISTKKNIQEQLGYIVFCGVRKTNGVQGIRIIVQSAKHPSYVETRIESFLKNMTVSNL